MTDDRTRRVQELRRSSAATPIPGKRRDAGDGGLAERCYRPGCRGWVTGASDYCSPQCESLVRSSAPR